MASEASVERIAISRELEVPVMVSLPCDGACVAPCCEAVAAAFACSTVVSLS